MHREHAWTSRVSVYVTVSVYYNVAYLIEPQALTRLVGRTRAHGSGEVMLFVSEYFTPK